VLFSGEVNAMNIVRNVALALAIFGPVVGPASARDFSQISIETQQVAEDLYVLYGAGGNMLVSIGNQGVLMIDDQFPEMVPKYRAAIAELGSEQDIAFVINTHWHYDHADANVTLGPEGTWFVSQENARRMMMRHNIVNAVSTTTDQPAYPPEAWPVLTYDNSMHVHFNGQQLDLLHFGPAHTTGDTAIIFRDRNVVHMGDVFHNSRYPFVDADNGGTLLGIIEFSQAVLDEIEPGSVVVPGHGNVSDYQGLVEYISMLRIIHARMSALISDGASLDDIVAAKPTAEWDEVRGDPANFLNRAYTSMTR